VRELIEEVEACLPEGAWPNAHTGNFDEWRVVNRFGEAGARQAAMLLLTMRGTPLLYYGEEIGMTNVAIPPEYEKDPMGKRIGLNRDPQRTPMQWNRGPHAGFSDHTTSKLWLPVSSNYRQVNVETQLADRRSMLNLYRQLIAYRKGNPALIQGSFSPVKKIPETCYAYVRQSGPLRILVALNFAQEPCWLALPQFVQGEIVLNTFLNRSGPVDLDGFELGANEGLMIELLEE
jgi:alpha-glucosidase